MKMGVPANAMHAKSDSEVTSIDASSPPRSPRRALYYVQSPSHHDLEKMSYGSSPCGSPRNYHYHYHCSPIHHSRESSTSRFSASLKITRNPAPWKRLPTASDHLQPQEDDDQDQQLHHPHSNFKFYVLCFLISFLLLFSIFSLILWAASTPYKPTIFVKVCLFKLSFLGIYHLYICICFLASLYYLMHPPWFSKLFALRNAPRQVLSSLLYCIFSSKHLIWLNFPLIPFSSSFFFPSP